MLKTVHQVQDTKPKTCTKSHPKEGGYRIRKTNGNHASVFGNTCIVATILERHRVLDYNFPATTRVNDCYRSFVLVILK